VSITLASADLEKLTQSVQLLVSPLDHPSVDQWRSAVNHQLKELLCADSAGFLLPVPAGLMMYSEEHDPSELSKYQDVVAPDMADGTPIWEQMIRSGVGTLANMYGRDYDRYLGSAYYNEYAGANEAHDTLSAAIPLGGLEARSMASLHFWHARPDGRLFGEREVALLRLLFPAFRAGVQTQVRWGGHRADLLSTLDALGQAVLVCDPAGQILHQTPALTAALEADPESETLRAELLGAMEAVRGTVPIRGASAWDPPGAATQVIRTQSARYVVRGSLYGGPPAGSAAMILVALERLTPAPRPEAELREAFGLTRAEVRVAALLARGKSNAETARELFISPHTARRHTEQIMRKLRVRSRAEVGASLFN
jgi:DNA-binding CsgD family transcriptional regulator